MALALLSGCQQPQANPPDDDPDDPNNPQMMECGTEAALCAAQAKSCGSFTTTDACGKSRKIDCGGCAAPLTCGGGGTANVCGISCLQGCPSGYTCSSSGVCEGSSSSSLVLNVKAVQLSGTLTLNGSTPADGARCAGAPTVSKARLLLTDAAHGTSIAYQVPCSASSYAWNVLVPPGTYQVSVYGYGSDYSSLPSGQAGLSAPFTVTSAQSNVVFDVKGVQLSGTIKLNGSTPADGARCTGAPTVSKARISFDNLTTGTSIAYQVPCSASSYAWNVLVPPGTYQVSVYGYGTDYSLLPSGQAGTGTPFTVTTAQSNVVFDLKAVQLSGTLTLNGSTPTDGARCAGAPTVSKARILLTDSAHGTSIAYQIPCSASSYAWNVLVPPGTYQVTVYGYGTDYSLLPSGQVGLSAPITVTSAQSGVVFDVKAVQLSGMLNLNGSTPADGPRCAGAPTVSKARVSLDNLTTGTSVAYQVPCSASSYAWNVLLPPGTYRVTVYGYGTDYSLLPSGMAGLSSPFTVTSAQSNVVFDVKAVQLGGTVTLNGNTPADGPRCTGAPTVSKARVSFDSATTGTSISYQIPCSSSSYQWSVLVPPGTYQITIYGYGSDYSELPSGSAGVPALAIH